MSASKKTPLSELSRGDLEALSERLLAENAALKQAIAELRAEVATLKGLQSRPRMKPSGMDKGSEPALDDQPRGRGAKSRKSERLTVDEERVIKAAVPSGSRFKGYEDFLVQDLVLRPHVVRIRRERWSTPDGLTVTAPMPINVTGHFGPELRRFVLFQYHQGQVTVPRLVTQLRAIGIVISKRQVVRLLNEDQDTFLEEARDVLRAGLATAAWISVDDTGARHQHQNGFCTQLGNDHFAAFATTGAKSRLNFLELLRAGYRDYVINAEALAYMRQRSLAGPVITRLVEDPARYFPNEAAWLRHLDRLGITKLTVTPDPMRIATEGALWGSIKAHGLLPDTVILSDNAGQFAVDRHALCWVHAERLVHKLDTFTDRQHAAQQYLRALIWWYYADLKAYRREPDRRRRTALRARFDRIFRRRTGFATLDRLLQRLHANKNELLLVLDRPEVPLHTNSSERDLRPQVIRRKISGGTRSDNGRTCRDAFLGLLLTCAKLGISFWDYLGDRLVVPTANAPYLPDLVRLRSAQA
jgi:cell division septum initiation protein DivIVA